MLGTFTGGFVVLPFHLKGAFVMDMKEFVEAILKADEETINLVCQFLEVNPLLVVSQDLPLGISHKASWHIQ